MNQRSAEQWVALGDRLLKKHRTCLATAAYARGADALLGRLLLQRSMLVLHREPLRAVRLLGRVERLVGPSREGRSLLAQAYAALGREDIAANFARAAALDERGRRSAPAPCLAIGG